MAKAKTDTHTLPLIGSRIKRIESVVDFNKVVVPNSSEAQYCISSDGRRWVRKRQLDTGFEALLAEALGWMLARELQVPVPDGAVTGTGDDLSWLSEMIPHVEHWEAGRVPYIQNLDDLGRMLTLDAIIHNADRHAGNILLQPTETEVELKAWCIDCGDSYLGHPGSLAEIGLGLPSTKNIARGLPVAQLYEGALAAAEAASSMSTHMLQTMVDEACGIVAEPGRDTLMEALWTRMKSADRLAQEYLKKIEMHL